MAGVPLSSVYYSVSGLVISYANDLRSISRQLGMPCKGYAIIHPAKEQGRNVALLGHRNANEGRGLTPFATELLISLVTNVSHNSRMSS